MDEEARREISYYLDVQPIKVDPADTLPFSRPQLAWCFEVLYEMDELTLTSEADYVRATVCAGQVQEHQWVPGGGRADKIHWD